jgi:HSP20 family protein
MPKKGYHSHAIASNERKPEPGWRGYSSGKFPRVENRARANDLNLAMDPIRTIKLRWGHGAMSDVTYQLTRFRFSKHAAHTWQPAINAYRCETSFRVCVDLAGVERSDIDLHVEPRRLVLRGERETPEPNDKTCPVLQTIAMEIDYGPFLRILNLSAEVDVEKVTAEQKNGFLWISLRLKES